MFDARAARDKAVIPLTAKQVVKSSLSAQPPKYCIILLTELSLSILLSITPGAARVLTINTATIANTFILILFFLLFSQIYEVILLTKFHGKFTFKQLFFFAKEPIYSSVSDATE
jgi:hypothetical protein